MTPEAVAVGLAPDALRRARWSGLAAVDVVSVDRVEAFAFDDGSRLELVEAVAADGARTRLTLPSDDPLLPASPGPWLALHRLATEGGIARGDRGGRLAGIPVAAGPPARDAEPGGGDLVRRSEADQSHTSVIVGGAILKLYRRLPAGPNPEVELLAALADVGDPALPVPPMRGSVEHRPAAGRPNPVAIVQDFLPDASDAFEDVANEIAADLARVVASEADARVPRPIAPASLALAGATGAALARLHAALAAIDRPGFEPGPPTPVERAAWHARARRRVAEAIETLRERDPEVAALVAGVEDGIVADLAALDDGGPATHCQRIHGDLHLGQVLATARGVVFVDFEGDPLRDPEERAAPGPGARDVASLLRSLDHVARSGRRRAGEALGPAVERTAGATAAGARMDAALDDWIGAARRRFLDAYRAAAPPDPVDPALLRALELEKAMLELRYAAAFLPGWLYAPVAALPGLLAGRESPS